MPGKTSTEKLRQRLMELLDRETAGMHPQPELTFTWDMGGRAAAIRRLSPQRVRAEINLRTFGLARIPSEGALEFSLSLCAGAAAEALRLWESAAVSSPRSYLQGLAYIEMLHRMESGRGDLFVPLWGDSFPGKFTAADLFCAAVGARRALERCGERLSREELALQRGMLETLEVLSQVPEVVCRGRKLPVSSMVRCVRTAGALLERRPELARSVPALKALSGHDGRLCTLEELTEREDPLCRGIALRLVAFGDGEIGQRLEEAAHEFRRHSVDFVRLCGSAKSGILRDNLLALERLNGALNRKSERYGMPCRTGSVHPLDRG